MTKIVKIQQSKNKKKMSSIRAAPLQVLYWSLPQVASRWVNWNWIVLFF